MAKGVEPGEDGVVSDHESILVGLEGEYQVQGSKLFIHILAVFVMQFHKSA